MPRERCLEYQEKATCFLDSGVLKLANVLAGVLVQEARVPSHISKNLVAMSQPRGTGLLILGSHLLIHMAHTHTCTTGSQPVRGARRVGACRASPQLRLVPRTTSRLGVVRVKAPDLRVKTTEGDSFLGPRFWKCTGPLLLPFFPLALSPAL